MGLHPIWDEDQKGADVGLGWDLQRMLREHLNSSWERQNKIPPVRCCWGWSCPWGHDAQVPGGSPCGSFCVSGAMGHISLGLRDVVV